VSNDVFANGREVACKSGSGKAVAALPDVCFTPPQTPATPPGVPVPYPVSSFASDTTSGTKKVKISGKEIMEKNESSFKKCTGDEAGCAPKKGVITSTKTGKVYFLSWSMDVKFEGKNAVRHLDRLNSNHSSPTANQATPWPFLDSQALAPEGACHTEAENEKTACGGKTPSQACRSTACQKARKCMLTEYGGKGSPNCCSPQVAHHIVPNSLLQGERGNSSTNVVGLRKSGSKAYTLENAPCVCCSGKKGVSTPIGTHKIMHNKTKEKIQDILMKGDTLSFSEAKNAAIQAHNETFLNENGEPQCSPGCLDAQIDSHMKITGTGKEVKVHQKDGATNAKYDKYKAGDTD
jgi:hypothetical protein